MESSHTSALEQAVSEAVQKAREAAVTEQEVRRLVEVVFTTVWESYPCSFILAFPIPSNKRNTNTALK